MSGYIPEWIKTGSYVLYHGKKKKVKEIFFTSVHGPHNSDKLNVLLVGVRGAVNWPDIQSLKKKKLTCSD